MSSTSAYRRKNLPELGAAWDAMPRLLSQREDAQPATEAWAKAVKEVAKRLAAMSRLGRMSADPDAEAREA